MTEEHLDLRIRALVAEVADSSPEPPPFPTGAVARGTTVDPTPEVDLHADELPGPRRPNRRSVLVAAVVLAIFVTSVTAVALLARGHAGPTAATDPPPTQDSTPTTSTPSGPVLSGLTSDGRRFEVQTTSTDPMTICVRVGSDDIGCTGPPIWPEDLVYVGNHGTPLVYGQLPPNAVSVTLDRPDGTVITDGFQFDPQTRVWAMPIPAPESATELVNVEPFNLTVVFHLEDGSTIERRPDAG